MALHPHALISQLIDEIGDDYQREGLRDTPRRVVASWLELFAGVDSKEEPADILTWFEEECDQMVILRGIEFYSTCEHHMLPFFGTVAIAYEPQGKIVGVSKLVRLVTHFTRRLTVQERFTKQIGEMLANEVTSVGVSVTGQHLCMMARGVAQSSSLLTTNFLAGDFRDEPEARQEFFAAVQTPRSVLL